MTIPELIAILENRVASLEKARGSLVASGDMAGVVDVDNQVTETQATLDQLRTLVP